MSSLLMPVALESCQTSLRGRRRSSIHPISAVPRLFSSTSSAVDDCAVSDDPIPSGGTPETDRPSFSSPPSISPLSDAHISDYFTSTAAPRHKNTAPPLYTYDIPSPTSTLAPNSFNHKTVSSSNDKDDMTLSKPDHLKWRLASGFFAYFLCGWGDGVTGTVLPYFTAEFRLTPMTSSLLFAGSTCGFAIGTLLVECVMNRLGRFNIHPAAKSCIPSSFRRLFSARNDDVPRYSASQARSLVLAISSVLHAFHFIMIGAKGGFSVTFLAYALAAFSRALLTASLNAYFADGPKQSLGYAYGLWSFGGVISPLVCQSLAATGVPWVHFYFGSLVLSGLNTTFLVSTFKPTSREFLRERGSNGARKHSIDSDHFAHPSPSDNNINCQVSSTPPDVPPPVNTFRLALSKPYQWAFSIFALFYCGSETTTQGFMVTYLLATRRANPRTVGYVTSGFWGGITIGRFVWGYFTPSLSFMQKKFTILGCIAIALVMQLLIWFVNSNIENAFSTSVIGALYGPIFPACLSMANDILPSEIQMVSMTIISASASLGSALFPFIAGAVASVKGVHTLTYLTVPLGAAMLCMWSLFPSRIPTRSYHD